VAAPARKAGGDSACGEPLGTEYLRVPFGEAQELAGAVAVPAFVIDAAEPREDRRAQPRPDAVPKARM
jgi:hypothetical protein